MLTRHAPDSARPGLQAFTFGKWLCLKTDEQIRDDEIMEAQFCEFVRDKISTSFRHDSPAGRPRPATIRSQPT